MRYIETYEARRMTHSQESRVSSSQDTLLLREENRTSVSALVNGINACLSGADVSVNNESLKVEKMAATSNQEGGKQQCVYPWLPNFEEVCRSSLGCRNMKKLETLMTVFLGHVSESVKDCYTRPNRAAKLRKCLNETLMFFHMFYQDVRKPGKPARSLYLDMMTDLVAMYIDMEIKAACRQKEKGKKITSRVTSSLYLLLDKSEDHVLDAILKAKLINKQNKDVCLPMLGKIVNQVPLPLSEMSYVRYLLIFKLFKKVIQSTRKKKQQKSEEEKRINKLAVLKLKPPDNFVEKAKIFTNVLPKIPPKSKKNVTHFFMQAKLNLKSACAAFLKGVKEFQESLYGSTDKDLFCSKQLTVCPVNNDKVDGGVGSNGFSTDMWSSLDLESLMRSSQVKELTSKKDLAGKKVKEKDKVKKKKKNKNLGIKDKKKDLEKIRKKKLKKNKILGVCSGDTLSMLENKVLGSKKGKGDKKKKKKSLKAELTSSESTDESVSLPETSALIDSLFKEMETLRKMSSQGLSGASGASSSSGDLHNVVSTGTLQKQENDEEMRDVSEIAPGTSASFGSERPTTTVSALMPSFGLVSGVCTAVPPPPVSNYTSPPPPPPPSATVSLEQPTTTTPHRGPMLPYSGLYGSDLSNAMHQKCNTDSRSASPATSGLHAPTSQIVSSCTSSVSSSRRSVQSMNAGLPAGFSPSIPPPPLPSYPPPRPPPPPPLPPTSGRPPLPSSPAPLQPPLPRSPAPPLPPLPSTPAPSSSGFAMPPLSVPPPPLLSFFSTIPPPPTPPGALSHSMTHPSVLNAPRPPHTPSMSRPPSRPSHTPSPPHSLHPSSLRPSQTPLPSVHPATAALRPPPMPPSLPSTHAQLLSNSSTSLPVSVSSVHHSLFTAAISSPCVLTPVSASSSSLSPPSPSYTPPLSASHAPSVVAPVHVPLPGTRTGGLSTRSVPTPPPGSRPSPSRMKHEPPPSNVITIPLSHLQDSPRSPSPVASSPPSPVPTPVLPSRPRAHQSSHYSQQVPSTASLRSVVVQSPPSSRSHDTLPSASIRSHDTLPSRSVAMPSPLRTTSITPPRTTTSSNTSSIAPAPRSSSTTPSPRVVSATLPPSSTTSAILPPSSTTSATLPPSSTTTATLPPSSTTSATLPPSTTTATLPPSSTTSAILPPSTTTSATPPPSSTTSTPPPSSTTFTTSPPSRIISATPPLSPTISSSPLLSHTISTSSSVPQSVSSPHTSPAHSPTSAKQDPTESIGDEKMICDSAGGSILSQSETNAETDLITTLSPLHSISTTPPPLLIPSSPSPPISTCTVSSPLPSLTISTSNQLVSTVRSCSDGITSPPYSVSIPSCTIVTQISPLAHPHSVSVLAPPVTPPPSESPSSSSSSSFTPVAVSDSPPTCPDTSLLPTASLPAASVSVFSDVKDSPLSPSESIGSPMSHSSPASSPVSVCADVEMRVTEPVASVVHAPSSPVPILISPALRVAPASYLEQPSTTTRALETLPKTGGESFLTALHLRRRKETSSADLDSASTIPCFPSPVVTPSEGRLVDVGAEVEVQEETEAEVPDTLSSQVDLAQENILMDSRVLSVKQEVVESIVDEKMVCDSAGENMLATSEVCREKDPVLVPEMCVKEEISPPEERFHPIDTVITSVTQARDTVIASGSCDAISPSSSGSERKCSITSQIFKTEIQGNEAIASCSDNHDKVCMDTVSPRPVRDVLVSDIQRSIPKDDSEAVPFCDSSIPLSDEGCSPENNESLHLNPIDIDSEMLESFSASQVTVQSSGVFSTTNDDVVYEMLDGGVLFGTHNGLGLMLDASHQDEPVSPAIEVFNSSDRRTYLDLLIQLEGAQLDLSQFGCERQDVVPLDQNGILHNGDIIVVSEKNVSHDEPMSSDDNTDENDDDDRRFHIRPRTADKCPPSGTSACNYTVIVDDSKDVSDASPSSVDNESVLSSPIQSNTAYSASSSLYRNVHDLDNGKGRLPCSAESFKPLGSISNAHSTTVKQGRVNNIRCCTSTIHSSENREDSSAEELSPTKVVVEETPRSVAAQLGIDSFTSCSVKVQPLSDLDTRKAETHKADGQRSQETTKAAPRGMLLDTAGSRSKMIRPYMDTMYRGVPLQAPIAPTSIPYPALSNPMAVGKGAPPPENPVFRCSCADCYAYHILLYSGYGSIPQGGPPLPLSFREPHIESDTDKLKSAEKLKSEDEELLRRIEESLSNNKLDAILDSKYKPELDSSLPPKKRLKTIAAVSSIKSESSEKWESPKEDSFPSYPTKPMISIAELDFTERLISKHVQRPIKTVMSNNPQRYLPYAYFQQLQQSREASKLQNDISQYRQCGPDVSLSVNAPVSNVGKEIPIYPCCNTIVNQVVPAEKPVKYQSPAQREYVNKEKITQSMPENIPTIKVEMPLSSQNTAVTSWEYSGRQFKTPAQLKEIPAMNYYVGMPVIKCDSNRSDSNVMPNSDVYVPKMNSVDDVKYGYSQYSKPHALDLSVEETQNLRISKSRRRKNNMSGEIHARSRTSKRSSRNQNINQNTDPSDHYFPAEKRMHRKHVSR